MQESERRTGQRMTYARLSVLTGISKAALESLGSRDDYNPTLDTIDRICSALGCGVGELLELMNEEGVGGN